MPVVPPGNKQIGDYSMSITFNTYSATHMLASAGMAVAKDGTNTTPVKPPLNLQVGDYSMSVTLRSDTLARVLSSAGLCVTKYTPPAQGNALALAAIATLATPTSILPVGIRNLQIGDYAMSITMRTPSASRLLALGGIVVVQQITKRIETILMDIYYPSGV